jgi:hypothetical protein
MAKTISQLTDATVVNGSDELIVQQSGVTKRATKTELLNGIVNANIAADAAIVATKLASDSITNTQIKSDAAIEGTKIDPDFGAQSVDTTGNVSAARLVAADGTNTLPSVTFTGDGNTGIFHPEADTIAFCEGGVEAMRINSSGQVGIGTASPGYRLDVAGIVNTSSNFAVAANQVVGARRLGWATPTGTNKRTTYATTTVTLEELAQVVKALIIDLEAHGLIGPTP